MGSTARTKSYSAVRLNTCSEHSWAVISVPSGAIARDDHDKLLFKMTKDEASWLADALTEALKDAKDTSHSSRHKALERSGISPRLWGQRNLKCSDPAL